MKFATIRREGVKARGKIIPAEDRRCYLKSLSPAGVNSHFLMSQFPALIGSYLFGAFGRDDFVNHPRDRQEKSYYNCQPHKL